MRYIIFLSCLFAFSCSSDVFPSTEKNKTQDHLITDTSSITNLILLSEFDDWFKISHNSKLVSSAHFLTNESTGASTPRLEISLKGNSRDTLKFYDKTDSLVYSAILPEHYNYIYVQRINGIWQYHYQDSALELE